MKKINVFGILSAILVIVIAIIALGWYLVKSEPVLIQGTVECTSYKASSKIAGRIDAMKVKQGEAVEKGQLLYTLSTPELDAKLQQAEAVRSAAKALDDKAVAGVRSQQIESALNMWQKAQTGKELAKKTYERVQNLYRDGVVPAQKLDEAKANYDAMVATENAAHSQYRMALEGARKEEKAAAAAQVRQAQGVVKEVEAYLGDAMIYSPVAGEISSIISEEGELVGSGYPVVTILDLNDAWITFNIKETMLPKIEIGKSIEAYIPALDKNIALEVSYIAVQADFATWNATRTQGSFDIRTFAVKMKPTDAVSGLRPGMSAIVNWSAIE
ncbi:MAG: HlyD family secretion protein [Alistipes sp.]